ncbi:SUMO-activating enzyme subunit 1B-1-like [Iris pallida]|uniref:SUMO-activating enzyme subunit 1B-1-like n=1 Tax=Iris pallida TaxID=29817 RepID=A0AAX6HSX4_IRIPA|nr:SUMO-activating enzyme subunit 1B-1-like [Iris pallida]
MDGEEELTAQQTALYDRQIRVWGVDAQKKLSKAHILVSGLDGTAVEFCKNIVLAGVGSLTLMDDRKVTEDAIQANFLIPLYEAKNEGRSLAELCCDSLREFNPMVHVSVEKGDLAQFNGEFFDKFEAVVVSSCSLENKIAIDEKCRKRPKRIAFYAIGCRDSCGEIFVDLQDYTYKKKKSESKANATVAATATTIQSDSNADSLQENSHVVCNLQYPSLQEAISIPWNDLPRKLSKLYYAMRVIEKFESSGGKSLGDTSTSDLPAVLKLRKEICEAQSFNEMHVPTGLLERLLAAGNKEYPPVCAILGGILGQEVIKAISGKGDPLKNFFYFDVADGKGLVEDISNPREDTNSTNGQNRITIEASSSLYVVP